MAPGQLSLFPAPTTSRPPSRAASIRKNGSSDERRAVSSQSAKSGNESSPKLQSPSDLNASTPTNNSSAEKPAQLSQEVKSPAPGNDIKPSSQAPAPKKGILKRPSESSIGSRFSSNDIRNVANTSQLNKPIHGTPTPPVSGSVAMHKQDSASSRWSESSPSRSEVASPSNTVRQGPLSPLLDHSQLEQPFTTLHSPSRPPHVTSRASSPAMTRSNSTAKPPIFQSADECVPMRSMFPQYDHGKALTQQNYYPTQSAVAPLYQDTSRAQAPQMDEKKTLRQYDSAVGLVEGYEHIPAAQHADFECLWKAAAGEFPTAARKVQFNLVQPQARSIGQTTALAIGVSQSQIVYDMDTDLAVRRHRPKAAMAMPVAQITLPHASSAGPGGLMATEIFPHPAAVHAMEQLAHSVGAEAPNLASLQEQALANVHRRHACTLFRKARRSDQPSGVVVASYTLGHPTLGDFSIEVTKSSSGVSAFMPKAKISLHHPSATPAAIAAGTLNLAFLDFARDACVLDIPGLVALGNQYLPDTVVSALFAVAAIENDALVAESLVFEAPPKTPIQPVSSRKSLAKRESHFSTKSRKDKSKKKDSLKGRGKSHALETAGFVGAEEVKLPLLARGTIAVLGVSVKAAIFVLQTSFKVTAGVVVGVSHLATKL